MLNGPNWRRRLVTVPTLYLVAVLVIVLLPLLVVAALLHDLVGGRIRRVPSLRTLCFAVSLLVLDLWCTTVLLGPLFILQLTGVALAERLHRGLQVFWARSLMRVSRVFGGIKVNFPHDTADILAEPSIILARHTAYPDALVPLLMIHDVAKGSATYVLMRELLWDPAMDLCGQRFDNHFTRRGAGRAAAEVAAIGALAERSGPPQHSLVIFPEGGLADDAKRAAIAKRMSEQDPERAERLADLRHLIPFRPPGTLALLDGVPDADVVTIAHAGLEGLASFGELWRAVPVRRPVTVEIRRHPRSSLPDSHEELIEWVDDRWVEMDAWIESELAGWRDDDRS